MEIPRRNRLDLADLSALRRIMREGEMHEFWTPFTSVDPTPDLTFAVVTGLSIPKTVFVRRQGWFYHVLVADKEATIDDVQTHDSWIRDMSLERAMQQALDFDGQRLEYVLSCARAKLTEKEIEHLHTAFEESRLKAWLAWDSLRVTQYSGNVKLTGFRHDARAIFTKVHNTYYLENSMRSDELSETYTKVHSIPDLLDAIADMLTSRVWLPANVDYPTRHEQRKMPGCNSRWLSMRDYTVFKTDYYSQAMFFTNIIRRHTAGHSHFTEKYKASWVQSGTLAPLDPTFREGVHSTIVVGPFSQPPVWGVITKNRHFTRGAIESQSAFYVSTVKLDLTPYERIRCNQVTQTDTPWQAIHALDMLLSRHE